MGDQRSSLPSLVKVRARTRLSETEAAIRRIVLDGVVATGGRLKDQELAQALGVSRATVREAARELVHEGLLVHEPYKGLRVASIDDQGWLDLAEVRAVLETLAAQRVARSLTPEMDAQLELALRQVELAGASGEVASINETHSALHELIQRLSGNPVLEKTWESIGRRARVIIRLDLEVYPERDRSRSIGASYGQSGAGIRAHRQGGRVPHPDGGARLDPPATGAPGGGTGGTPARRAAASARGPGGNLLVTS